jgi:hypothetical protein
LVLGVSEILTDFGDVMVELDPSAVQAYVRANATHLGLWIERWGSLHQFGFAGMNSDQAAPQLTVTYSVPEPLSASLMILGMAGMLVRRRRMGA